LEPTKLLIWCKWLILCHDVFEPWATNKKNATFTTTSQVEQFGLSTLFPLSIACVCGSECICLSWWTRFEMLKSNYHW
jgi:hypothetical protein